MAAIQRMRTLASWAPVPDLNVLAVEQEEPGLERGGRYQADAS
jgi:hypothetical protein